MAVGHECEQPGHQRLRVAQGKGQQQPRDEKVEHAADGETTWFEGVLLVAVYLVLAMAFFFVGR